MKPGWYEVQTFAKRTVVRWWDGRHWWYDKQMMIRSTTNPDGLVRRLILEGESR